MSCLAPAGNKWTIRQQNHATNTTSGFQDVRRRSERLRTWRPQSALQKRRTHSPPKARRICTKIGAATRSPQADGAQECCCISRWRPSCSARASPTRNTQTDHRRSARVHGPAWDERRFTTAPSIPLAHPHSGKSWFRTGTLFWRPHVLWKADLRPPYVPSAFTVAHPAKRPSAPPCAPSVPPRCRCRRRRGRPRYGRRGRRCWWARRARRAR